jgi:dolichol-phosphate mannosyltransferase
LSRNFTSHYSVFAGLSVAKGACAVAIPDDEQQPYGTLVEMYRLWQNGHKIIFPYRVSREDPWMSKLFSNIFYKVMNTLSDVTYPEGGVDICLIDREVIDILNSRIHPINTTTITEILRLGFDPYSLPYERPLGTNRKSRWSFKKKVKLAMDTFFSCSSFPIKLITYSGLFFCFFSVCLICLYTYIALFGNKKFWGVPVPGWTSLVIFISFFSGIILFSLGVIAEYVWRIYEEVKNRPGYIIRK